MGLTRLIKLVRFFMFNTRLQLQNSNRKGSLSLDWTYKFLVSYKLMMLSNGSAIRL